MPSHTIENSISNKIINLVESLNNDAAPKPKEIMEAKINAFCFKNFSDAIRDLWSNLEHIFTAAEEFVDDAPTFLRFYKGTYNTQAYTHADYKKHLMAFEAACEHAGSNPDYADAKAPGRSAFDNIIGDLWAVRHCLTNEEIFVDHDGFETISDAFDDICSLMENYHIPQPASTSAYTLRMATLWKLKQEWKMSLTRSSTK